MNLLSCKQNWDDNTGFQIEYNPANNKVTVIGSGNDVAEAANVD